MLLRDVLEADGLTPFAKTSGLEGHAGQRAGRRSTTRRCTSEYAHAVAKRLEREHAGAGRVADDKSLRPGKVLRRLEPEQPGEDDRRAVLAAGAADTRPCRPR